MSSSKRVSIAKYHSSIKWDIIKNLKLKDNSAVLDLAVGRGGDLFKYTSRSVDLILGIDIDAGAVFEAQERWDKKPNPKVTLRLLAEDAASENVPSWIRKTTRRKFNLTVCNFAIHYFFKDKTKLSALVDTMAKHTKKGGFVWITCPDGGSLFRLLKGKKQISTPAYSLKLISSSSPPTNATSCYGQAIEYKLNKTRYFTKAKPGEVIMSNQGVSYEYLVDILELKAVMKKNGFESVSSDHFSTWEKQFSKISKQMKRYEKEISFANISLVFRKV